MSAEEWLQTLPGGPEELLSSLLRHTRSSRYGSRLFATSVCLRNDVSPIEPKETPIRWTLKSLCTSRKDLAHEHYRSHKLHPTASDRRPSPHYPPSLP